MICLLAPVPDDVRDSAAGQKMHAQDLAEISAYVTDREHRLARTVERWRRRCPAMCLPQIVIVDGQWWWYTRRCLAVAAAGKAMCAVHTRENATAVHVERAEARTLMAACESFTGEPFVYGNPTASAATRYRLSQITVAERGDCSPDCPNRTRCGRCSICERDCPRPFQPSNRCLTSDDATC